jgi:dipeptide/tripeptide permease
MERKSATREACSDTIPTICEGRLRAASRSRGARRHTVGVAQRWTEVREGFQGAFWVANITELFERLAYYATFSVLAIYLHETLKFSEAQAGDLIGYFSAVVWFLPILGGTLADWLGFRKSLALAYLVLSVGYFLFGSLSATWMAPLRDSMPLTTLVLLILTVPAIGPAIVKPCVVGTTARASTENVRSLGYSIYYTLVNVGSTFGPLMALAVRRSIGIENVFRVSAAFAFLMFLSVLVFFREPRAADEPTHTSFAQSFKNLFVVLTNFRFMLFLVIFSGYWIIFWQEFIALPLFLRGYVNANADVEFLLTVDPLAVILLQIAISHWTRKIPSMSAMALGTVVSSASWILFAAMNLGWHINGSWQIGPWTLTVNAVPVWGIVALFILAVGEMIQSPRFYEYVSRLAPPGQQGVFMGFAFLPIAIGSATAGIIGGRLVAYFGAEGRNPQHMWWVVAVIGFVTALLLWLYDKFLAPKQEPSSTA